VSGSVQRLDGRIPETLVLRIDPVASPEERKSFIERIEPILPHLNWRTHLFIVSEGSSQEMRFAREIIRALARFLVENQFVSFYVHPVIRIGANDGADSAGWKAMLDDVRPFQQQAYQQQTESRLLILPIIDPAAGTADRHWIKAAQLLLDDAARPSVLLRGSAASERARKAAGKEIRFYIEPEEGSGAEGLIRQLWTNAVFEDLLERVRAGVGGVDLLLPCRTHRVIDQPSEKVYSCCHEWSVDRPLDTLESISRAGGAGITGDCRRDACAGCISRSLSSMTESLIANERGAEGRKVHFELALAFSGSGRHREAIEHAARARDLASIDSDRSGALIIQGLCHLDLREFEEAERTLERAAASADDPGVVSFHRGRVQFEWRDYIEALERFEEALASGSEAVPRVDLFYYMAFSHLQIHEYREARPYLDRWRETGERQSSMLYYRGLCDIGEEEFESGLAELRASAQAGPAQQDLGNILFYTGYCLKELSRYEEAILALETAAESGPDEVDVFNLLGFCLYKTTRYAEAVDCFRRAIALDPRSAIDHANLARNLSELGRTDEAIAAYGKALSLDPNIGFARDNLQKLTSKPWSGPEGGAQ
jgi:tetratricopeptide (TPR) repeat protein